jgi:hypothetical protein
VAEWTDEFGFSPVAAKYVRLKPGSEIERNRTYIVTTIVVSTALVCTQRFSSFTDSFHPDDGGARFILTRATRLNISEDGILRALLSSPNVD